MKQEAAHQKNMSRMTPLAFDDPRTKRKPTPTIAQANKPCVGMRDHARRGRSQRPATPSSELMATVSSAPNGACGEATPAGLRACNRRMKSRARDAGRMYIDLPL